MLCGLALVVARCGGSSTSTTVLEPTDPTLAGLYISISAPSPVVDYIAHWALGASSGTIVVSKPQGPQVCSRQTKLTDAMIQYRVTPAEKARFTKYIGEPVTLTIYGTNPGIPAFCKVLSNLLSAVASQRVAASIASAVDSGLIVPASPFSRPRVGAPGNLSLASLRGKVVVLNFWQSYAPPCTSEAPVVSAAAKRWASRGVVFVGVDEQDLPGPATAFMRRFHISYPVIADDGPLIGHYGVTGYPETFFIDRRGRVIPMPPTQGQVGHIIGAATTATLNAGIRSALSH